MLPVLISKAKEFSKEAHQGKTRKGDGSPYFGHLHGAYMIARSVSDDPVVLASCYLHDTIEDTSVVYEDLLREFGKEIADVVLAVSEDKSIKDWHSRKARYLETVFSNEKAVLVAWADKIHNTRSLTKVKDFKVFNVSLKDKIAFYQKFADLLPDGKMKFQLNSLLTKYTM